MNDIDFDIKYEQLAERWANHFGKKFHHFGNEFETEMQLISALFTGVYQETIDKILIDPVLFSEKVSDYLYNLSMVDSLEC